MVSTSAAQRQKTDRAPVEAGASPVMGAESWEPSHGSRVMGAESWEPSHGAESWEPSHGSRVMGAESWEPSHESNLRIEAIPSNSGRARRQPDPGATGLSVFQPIVIKQAPINEDPCGFPPLAAIAEFQKFGSVRRTAKRSTRLL